MRARMWTIAMALLVILTVSGRGQTPATAGRLLVDMSAPRPIERGVSPVLSQAPDSPERLRRRSIRPATGPIDRVGRSGAPYVAGRLIVKFKGDVLASSRLAALSAISRTATVANRSPYANFDVVHIDPNDDAEAVAQVLTLRADVEYAQACYRMSPQFVPNDPDFPLQWNLPFIDLERAWDIQPAAGSTITAAVLDTGVAFTNATMTYTAGAFTVDQAGNIGPPNGGGTLYPALGRLTLSFVAATDLAASGRFVAPHDFIWNDNLPLDLDGHGTHVSGTIGQLTNNARGTAGVAFNVRLMPVKVVSTQWDDIFGSPNQGTDDVVALGVRYAVDNGAKVLNLSFGRPAPPAAPVVEDAIRYAVGKGAFVAIAAGNDFENGNPTEEPAEIASRIQGAVSVAAVDRASNHAYYSNTGSWVELAAPGGSFRGFGTQGGILQQTLNLDVVDTFDLPPSRFTAPRFDSLAYFFVVGTSQATPHVTGLAAMLMQQGITDPAAIEAALERFATDLGPPGRDDQFGFGLVEARNTLRGLGLAH
jgi:serine protease